MTAQSRRIRGTERVSTDVITTDFRNPEHPLFGGWAFTHEFATITAMWCGPSLKHKLGMVVGIMTLGGVRLLTTSCICLAAFCVTGRWALLNAAEQTIRYSARPALTEVVVGVLAGACGENEDRPAGVFMSLLGTIAASVIAGAAGMFARKLRPVLAQREVSRG